MCMLTLDTLENSQNYKECPVNATSCLLDPFYSDYISLEKAQQDTKIFDNTIEPNLNGKTS